MTSNRTQYDALYVQDQWTRNRLTLQGGLRYEYARSWFPDGENGITDAHRFGDPLTFPRTQGVRGYHDIYAPHGRGLRPVRQRQDVAQGQRQQVPAERVQRRGVYTISNPASRSCRPPAEAGPTPTATACADCEFMNAGDQRRVRRVVEPELRQPGLRPRRSTRTCWTGGASGTGTGSSASACSTRSCRGSRWRSATTGGGGGTSSSPTTVRSVRRTTSR